MNRLTRLWLLVFCLLLTACNNARIAEDISQTEANQIIALLAKHGIYAVSAKDDTGKPKYSVEVNSSFYTQAKTILVEKSLPRGDKTSFVDMVEARGLLPNSREIEALRLDHAMAIELEEALNAHSDIAGAKVVIRSHESEGANERAVSVILQEKNGRTINQADIQNIINKTVPGLKEGNVVLTVTKENGTGSTGEGMTLDSQGVLQQNGKEVYIPLTHFLFNWQVPEADYNAIVIVLIICFVVIGIIGWLVGYWYGYFKNSKYVIDQTLPDLNLRSLRLERPDRSSPTDI